LRRIIGSTWLAWLWASSAPLPAQAWIVLPTERPGGEVDAAIVQRIVRALAARSGLVLDIGEAAARFRERSSSEVGPADRALVAEVEDVVDALLVHAATRQVRLARRDIARLEELVARSRASFDRDARAARALQNGCLHAVRVVLERGEREGAKEEARRCMTRFPGIEPDIREHPPTIFGLLGEVRGELLARTLGSLRVDSAPRGCSAFLNGREVGATPVDIPGLIPGEYRVQVECAGQSPQSGRVHRAVVAAERKVLFVDTALDRAVRTSPSLALSYRDQREEAALRVSHARAIAHILDVERIVLVSVAGSGTVRLDRVDAGSQRVVASVVVALGPEQVARLGDRTALAVDALVRGESLAFDTEPATRIAAGSAEVPEAPRPAAAAPRSAPLAHRQLVARGGANPFAPLGWTLGTAGILTLSAGWIARGLDATGDDAVMATALAGGLLVGVAAPFILPPREGVPWWAWTAGLAGGGLGAWGVWAIADHGRCELRFASGGCRVEVRSADAGSLLVAAALPLLEVPFFYLLRPRAVWRRAYAILDQREGSTVVGISGVF
jgi:hypothetical protein